MRQMIASLSHAIRLAVNVPMDRRIQAWTTITLPSDWTAMRDRWTFHHGLPALASLVALASLFASTLERTDAAASGRAARPGEAP